MGAPSPTEPPVYRPFALLAFGATLLVGTPLGIWALVWLFAGGPAMPIDALLLHPSAQVFGFFATLIIGVAPHLVARFTGRPLTPTRLTPWLAMLLGGGLALRVAGAVGAGPAIVLGGALCHVAAFSAFTAWVWRALDPPPLARLRRHLTLSSAWLTAACALEVAVRARALLAGATVPDGSALRAVYALALLGGVVGWVLGVLLRAGPMFVADWRLSPRHAVALPWLLAAAAVLAAAGESGVGPRPAALARVGDALALAAVGVLTVGAGALRRGRRGPPMLSRSPHEARIFRLAVVSAALAGIGSLGAAVAEWSDAPLPLAADALRHLLAVGFLTSVVVAMAFRLIPVLELAPLPWPRLRDVAFAALVGAVVLRTAEMLVGHGWWFVAPLVPFSGVLVWLALACVAANLLGALSRARRR
jgi:hypothetical protein